VTEPVSHVGTKNFQARRAVLATGFTQMSAAVLTYVASALAGATSAGFFVAATYGLPLGNAGVIALLAGLILTALSFTLVPLAYSELRKGSEEGTDLKQALRIGRHILGIAYLVLAVAGALILVGGFTIPVLAVMPVAEKHKMLFVQGGTNATSIINKGNYKYTVTTLTTDLVWADPLVDLLGTIPADQRPKRAAFVQQVNPFLQGIVAATTPKIKGVGAVGHCRHGEEWTWDGVRFRQFHPGGSLANDICRR